MHRQAEAGAAEVGNGMREIVHAIGEKVGPRRLEMQELREREFFARRQPRPIRRAIVIGGLGDHAERRLLEAEARRGFPAARR